MVDPIVTPPHPPVVIPDPLPDTVALNPPMVGTASPFIRVDGQNRDLILEAIRAWARGPLSDWSAAWQTDLTKWLNDTDEWLDEWNTEVSRYVEDVLDAVINNSIEVQDPVVAELINDLSSLSFQAGASHFPVFRIRTNDGYPPRVDGAVNIFFGSVDPGLVSGTGDYWANPYVTTLAEVASAIRDPSSQLYSAVQFASVPPYVNIPLTVRSGDPATFTVAQGLPGFYGWLCAPNVQNRLAGPVVIPPEWRTGQVVVDYVPAAPATGDLRLARAGVAYKSGQPARPIAVSTNTVTVPSGSMPASYAITGAMDLTDMDSITVEVQRTGQVAADTFEESIYILEARLVKLS